MAIVRGFFNFVSGGALDRRDAMRELNRSKREYNDAVVENQDSQECLILMIDEYNRLKKSTYTNYLNVVTNRVSMFKIITIKERLTMQLTKIELTAQELYFRLSPVSKLLSSNTTDEAIIKNILGFLPGFNIFRWKESKKYYEDAMVEASFLDVQTEALRLISSNYKEGQEILELTGNTVARLIEFLDDLLPSLDVIYKKLCPLGKVSVIINKIIPSKYLMKNLTIQDKIIITNSVNITIVIAQIFKQVNVIKRSNIIDLSSKKMIENTASALGVDQSSFFDSWGVKKSKSTRDIKDAKSTDFFINLKKELVN